MIFVNPSRTCPQHMRASAHILSMGVEVNKSTLVRGIMALVMSLIDRIGTRDIILYPDLCESTQGLWSYDDDSHISTQLAREALGVDPGALVQAACGRPRRENRDIGPQSPRPLM